MFARFERDETKLEGVHPSLEPTVLKYLCPGWRERGTIT